MTGSCVYGGVPASCYTDSQCQAMYGPGYACMSGDCVYVGQMCTEGAVKVLSYCPDGTTWKTRDVCRFGNWIHESQVCPQCSAGEANILEYCADGTTWKTRQVCQNGAWKQETQPCPECAVGQTKDIEYCADGVTWKTQKTCENGVWIQQTNTKPCPQCWPEGTNEIVDRCSDGETWKTQRTCQNGVWVQQANTKPCPQCWPEGKRVESDKKCLMGGRNFFGQDPLWVDICTDGQWHREEMSCILPACLIATATYGSELSPEVQFLRNFRDQSVLQTRAGRQFMVAFNLWYYSFSPTVAQFIGTNEGARTLARGILYPLMGILHISSVTFSALASRPELAALAGGVVASSLIGLVYVAMPLAGVFWVFRRRIDNRTQRTVTTYIAILIALLLDGFIISELLGLDIMLTFVSAGIVLSFLGAGSILPAFKIIETVKRRF